MTSNQKPLPREEATEAPLIATGARAFGESSRALVLASANRRGRGRKLVAASILSGLALGYVAGLNTGVRPGLDAGARLSSLAQALPWKSEVASDAGDKRDIARLLDEVRSVRAQIESIRHGAETSRALERIRALEAGRDAAAETARAAATLASRVEKIEERLARVERAGTDPTPTGALPKPDRAPPVAGSDAGAGANRGRKTLSQFVLRDVGRGTAFVERGDGLVEEVAPGDNLPGAGRVTAIERRGAGWVVVTTRGVIDQRLD